MTPLFTKLNLKAPHCVHVLNAPASFEPELAALQGVTVLRSVNGPVEFALAFAITCAQRDAACALLTAAAQGDAILWLAYPKGSSKTYRAEFNRDGGWAVLGAAGFEPVRQVAIDADWSALRFRRAQHLGRVTRNPDGAISALGRERALKR
jgi:hypothetical protein